MIIQSQPNLEKPLCSLNTEFGTSSEQKPQDFISTISYSPCGKCVALGDHSGRVILFSKQQAQFKYGAEFPAYKPGHDWGVNMEVLAKVNAIHWIDSGPNMKLLTCNQKYIRFWKIFQAVQRKTDKDQTVGLVPALIEEEEDSFLDYEMRMELPDLHYGRIFHTALSQNKQILISVDKDKFLRWDLNQVDRAHILFERKDDSLKQDRQFDALDDVTGVKFHNQRDNCYGYSTKTGVVHYVDMRYSCTYQINSAKHADACVLQHQLKQEMKGVPFARYLQIVSDFCFTENEYEVVTRNFLRVSVWDMRKFQKPAFDIPIYPALIPKLSEFIMDPTGNRLKDKFQMHNAGKKVITNHYENSFHLFDIKNATNHRIKLVGNGQLLIQEIKRKGNPPDETLEADPRFQYVAYHPEGKGVVASNRKSIFFFDMLHI